MATHFKWYGEDSSVTIPWNRAYEFPSQANKALKTTPRIPALNETLSKSSAAKITIPAQGYINPLNSYISFDVEMTYTLGAGNLGLSVNTDPTNIRFQNNIASIFKQIELKYGSGIIESIREQNILTRCLTEWTSSGDFDQGSISEGIGYTSFVTKGIRCKGDVQTGQELENQILIPANARQAHIQGISLQQGITGSNDNMCTGGFGVIPATIHTNPTSVTALSCTRRYTIPIMLGMFQQGKLIPVKWMASQLSLEYTLAPAAECMFTVPGKVWQAGPVSTPYSGTPDFVVKNFTFIPEILEFDSSYDASFLKGLQSGGVPIKFSSWNHFSTSLVAGTQQTISIPEVNRSVKAVVSVISRTQADFTKDNGATFLSTSTSSASDTLQEYQYRVGGRYFPAAPVQCSTAVGSSLSNGGSEAYMELSKTLYTIGDYRLSTPVAVDSWAISKFNGLDYNGTAITNTYRLSEYDGVYQIVGANDAGVYFGTPATIAGFTTTETFPLSRAAQGTKSSCFGMAVNLETSSGLEISGLNASEQSNIELMLRFAQAQGGPDFTVHTFTFYDAMLILKENNIIELIK